MANINLNNVNKAEEELRLAHKDLVAFGKLFLPEDFKRSETERWGIYCRSRRLRE